MAEKDLVEFVRVCIADDEAVGNRAPVRSSTDPLVRGEREVEDLSVDEIRFRGLLESLPDATLILNAQGSVVLSNKRAARLFGRKRVELFYQQIEALFPDQHAGTLVEWLHECKNAFLDGAFEVDLRTIELHVGSSGGATIPVEVSIGPLPTTQGLMRCLIVRDITERRRLQREADKMKDDFLATVSHELRTPLTSILGYGELLEDLALEDLSGRAREFVEIISRSARRELRLVNDLLTLVQIGEGSLSIRPAQIDLHRIVREATEAAEPVAREAGITLSFVTDCDRAPVLGDADRLGQALDALLSNAIKFSPAGTDVSIEVRAAPTAITVTVANAGAGIPDGDIGNVFARLYRGENAITEQIQGAGLGLSIVRSIIEAHQGWVGARNTNAGACFEITLPRSGGQVVRTSPEPATR